MVRTNKRHPANRYRAAQRFTSSALGYLGKRAKSKIHQLGSAAWKSVNRKLFKKSGKPARKRSKYQKISSHIQGDDVHSGINANTVNIVQRPPSARKAIAHWKYSMITSEFVASSAGAQAAQTIWSSCRRNQFMVNTVAPVDGLHIANNLFELNNNRIQTGSALFATQSPANDMILVKEVIVNMMVTNLSTVSTVIELFFVEAKRDSSAEPLTVWNAGAVTEGLGNVQHVSPAVGIYGTGATSGYEISTDWKGKPTAFRNFNTFWKTRAVKKILLASAASHEMTVKIAVNKLVKREQLVTNGGDIVKGLTLDCLAIQYGQAIDDISSTNPGIPTIAGTKCAYVQRTHWNCSTVSGGRVVDDNIINQQIPFNATLLKQQDITMTDTVGTGLQG